TVARANFCPRSRVRSASGQIWSGPIMMLFPKYQKIAHELHAEASEYRVRLRQTLLGTVVCTGGNLLLSPQVELLCLVQLGPLACIRQTFVAQMGEFERHLALEASELGGRLFARIRGQQRAGG